MLVDVKKLYGVLSSCLLENSIFLAQIGCLGGASCGTCNHNKQKFIIDESDDDYDILQRKHGNPQQKKGKIDRNDCASYLLH